MMLSDVCLSVAYIDPNSTTERPRKTKIGTEVAHVTRDSDTTFKVKRSKVKVTGAGHIVAASRTTSSVYAETLVFCQFVVVTRQLFISNDLCVLIDTQRGYKCFNFP